MNEQERSKAEQVYEAYDESDQYWKDVQAVIGTSPLRNLVSKVSVQSSNLSKLACVDRIVMDTTDRTMVIIKEIVIDAITVFEEWDSDPIAAGCCPGTVFGVYRDSDGIWEAYDAIEGFSPIYRLMRPVLNFLCITHGTTRIGDWITRVLSDRYLVYIDGLIKDIIEHALDAYANSLTESNTSEFWTVR